VTVEFCGSAAGVYRALIRLSSEQDTLTRGSTIVDVNCTVMQTALLLLDAYTQQPVSSLDLGRVSFLEGRETSLTLRNPSPMPLRYNVSFVQGKMTQGEGGVPQVELGSTSSTLKKKGKRGEQDWLSEEMPLSVTPAKGIIPALSDVPLSLTFMSDMAEFRLHHPKVLDLTFRYVAILTGQVMRGRGVSGMQRERDQDSEEPLVLQVPVTAAAYRPSLALSARRVSFGSSLVGERQTKAFSVTNEGYDPCWLSLTTPNAYHVEAPRLFKLAPKEMRMLSVSFRPRNLGEFRANLTLAVHGHLPSSDTDIEDVEALQTLAVLLTGRAVTTKEDLPMQTQRLATMRVIREQTRAKRSMDTGKPTSTSYASSLSRTGLIRQRHADPLPQLQDCDIGIEPASGLIPPEPALPIPETELVWLDESSGIAPTLIRHKATRGKRRPGAGGETDSDIAEQAPELVCDMAGQTLSFEVTPANVYDSAIEQSIILQNRRNTVVAYDIGVSRTDSDGNVLQEEEGCAPITFGCKPPRGIVPPLASVSVTFTWTPGAALTETARATVSVSNPSAGEEDPPGVPLTLELRGFQQRGSAALVHSSVDFGQCPVGVPQVRHIELRNTGPSDCFFKVAPSSDRNIIVAQPVGRIAGSAASTVQVVFLPTHARVLETSLSIQVAGGKALTVQLTGKAETPTLTVSALCPPSAKGMSLAEQDQDRAGVAGDLCVLDYGDLPRAFGMDRSLRLQNTGVVEAVVYVDVSAFDAEIVTDRVGGYTFSSAEEEQDSPGALAGALTSRAKATARDKDTARHSDGHSARTDLSTRLEEDSDDEDEGASSVVLEPVTERQMGAALSMRPSDALTQGDSRHTAGKLPQVEGSPSTIVPMTRGSGVVGRVLSTMGDLAVEQRAERDRPNRVLETICTKHGIELKDGSVSVSQSGQAAKVQLVRAVIPPNEGITVTVRWMQDSAAEDGDLVHVCVLRMPGVPTDLLPRVSAVATLSPARLSLDTQTVRFGPRPVAITTPATGGLYYSELDIKNPVSQERQWCALVVDSHGRLMDSPLRVEPKRGTLGGNCTMRLRVYFSPVETGLARGYLLLFHSGVIRDLEPVLTSPNPPPIRRAALVERGVDVKSSDEPLVCALTGVGVRRSIVFDRTHVILPVVPPLIPSRVVINIHNLGYTEGSLRVRLPPYVSKVPLSVVWPYGNGLSPVVETLPVVITLYSAVPLSFQCKLAVIDHEGTEYPLYLSGTVDASFTGTEAFVRANKNRLTVATSSPTNRGGRGATRGKPTSRLALKAVEAGEAEPGYIPALISQTVNPDEDSALYKRLLAARSVGTTAVLVQFSPAAIALGASLDAVHNPHFLRDFYTVDDPDAFGDGESARKATSDPMGRVQPSPQVSNALLCGPAACALYDGYAPVSSVLSSLGQMYQAAILLGTNASLSPLSPAPPVAVDPCTPKASQRFLSRVVEFLFPRVSADNFPACFTDAHLDGRLAFDLLKCLDRKAPPYVSSNSSTPGSSSPSVLQHHLKQFDGLLRYLKRRGAMVNTVVPALLLSEASFTELTVGGIGREADTHIYPSTDRHSAPTYVGPLITGTAAGVLSSVVGGWWQMGHTAAWTLVIRETVRVLVLSRVTPQAVAAAIEDMERHIDIPCLYTETEGEGSPNGVQEEDSVLDIDGDESVSGKQASLVSPAAPASSSLRSSVQEQQLLTWLNFHVPRVMKGRAIKVTSFDQVGGPEIMALVYSHCPTLVRVRVMLAEYLRDKAKFQLDTSLTDGIDVDVLDLGPSEVAALNNQTRVWECVVWAFKEIGFGLHLASDRLRLLSPTDRVLLLLSLFVHLSHFVPQHVLTFETALSTSQSKVLRLTNPTRLPIQYKGSVDVIDEAMDGSVDVGDIVLADRALQTMCPFSVSDATVSLRSKEAANVTVTARPCFSKTVTALLMFLPKLNHGAPVVFILKLEIGQEEPPVSAHGVTKTYANTTIPVNIKNDFSQAGRFEVTLVNQTRVGAGSGKAHAQRADKNKDKKQRGGPKPVQKDGKPLSMERLEAALPADPVFYEPFHFTSALGQATNSSNVRLRAGEASTVRLRFRPLYPGTYKCQASGVPRMETLTGCVEAVEVEAIGIEQLLKAETKKGQRPALDVELDRRQAFGVLLATRIGIVAQYLEDNEEPLPAVVSLAQSVLNQATAVPRPQLSEAIVGKMDELAAVGFTSSLIRCVVALDDLIDNLASRKSSE
ncbi:hypothetical protein KIPB_000409, partial [Kipferlia bialata]